jgi:hypothetical protein
MHDFIPFDDAPAPWPFDDACALAHEQCADAIDAAEPPNTTPSGLMCIRPLPTTARMGVML